MQAIWVVASRDRLALQCHDPGPALTASFSVFPALNVGDVDADIETASPVLGLRPVRAGLFLVPKGPNPAIRTSSPLASASPMAANTPSTASLVTALFTRSPPPPSYPVLLAITRRAWRRPKAAPEETAHHARRRCAYRIRRTAGQRTGQNPRSCSAPRPRADLRISRSIVRPGTRSHRRHRFWPRNRDRARDVRPEPNARAANCPSNLLPPLGFRPNAR